MSRLGASAMRRAGRAAALLLLFLPVLSRAQGPPDDAASRVAVVRVAGSTRFPADTLARAIGLETGKVVSRADIQAAADRLGRLGWFEGVRYEFHTTTRGIEIDFTLTDAPSAPIWFDNFPWFSDAELIEAIRASGALYDGTAPVGGTALDAMREALAGLLRSRNLPGEVEGEMVVAPDSGNMVERFRVTGTNVRVAALEFSDPLAQQDKSIAAGLDAVVGKPYSRYALAIFLVEHVQPIYTSQGYLRARFGEPTGVFPSDPSKPLPDEITVRVPIEPGVQYHWAGASWSGGSALDAAALNTLIGFKPGEPADGLRLQGAWDRVAAEYKKHGYLDVKLEPAAHFDDAAAGVSFAVKITEGNQYRMGQLILTGLSLSAERQLLASWKIARGDVFDDSYFEDFVESGARKLFEKTPVHFLRIGHLLEPNPQTRTVDVKLDFQ